MREGAHAFAIIIPPLRFRNLILVSIESIKALFRNAWSINLELSTKLFPEGRLTDGIQVSILK
jgi:hypothetical protein